MAYFQRRASGYLERRACKPPGCQASRQVDMVGSQILICRGTKGEAKRGMAWRSYGWMNERRVK